MKSLLHGTVLLCLMTASTASAAETAHINFIGTINGATCSLRTSNIVIPLGTVDRRVFKGIGSVSAWAPNVALVSNGCNASLVSMTFTGPANARNPNLFAAAGGATGVGIQLAQAGGSQFAVPNGRTPMTFTPAGSGQGYSFSARYMQTDATITTGPANATITVLITYT